MVIMACFRSDSMSKMYRRKKVLFLVVVSIVVIFWSGKSFDFPSAFIYKNVYNASKEIEIRRNRTTEQCKHSTNRTPTDILYQNRNYMLFGHEDFLYCPITKVGSTTWKQILIILSGKCKTCTKIKDVKNVHDILNSYWNNKTKDDYKNILNRAHKMIIVREPYSRLLSGYVNKVFIPVRVMVFWKNTWQYVERNRKVPVKNKKCVDFTFPEIVRYVIKAIKTHTLHNDHFDTMSNMCKPCDIHYNTVLKMETFNQDTVFMLNKLNRSDLYNQSGELNKESRETEMIFQVNNIFRDDTGVCQSKAEKLRRLWRSFQISGYIGNEVNFPLSKGKENNITRKEFAKIVIEATQIGKHSDHTVNKKLALIEAYSQVPYSDLEELSKIFKQDCDVFGYDCRPDILFNRVKYPPSTKFFDIWSA